MYAVIAENDESQWSDQTGVAYHFPKRYLKLIPSGTKVIYYKGKLRSKEFASNRLSPDPHYFGVGVIGKVYKDKDSQKGDLFALIEDFKPFNAPVLSKNGTEYLEPIPKSRETNYWRDGVRLITEDTYHRVMNAAKIADQIDAPPQQALNDDEQVLESYFEGKPTVRYTTTYERNPKLRQQAVILHGESCAACGFNFGDFYGDYAAGFIHIHHLKPVSTLQKATKVDPETDLVPLCANCHSVVHRRKENILQLEDLKNMILKRKGYI